MQTSALFLTKLVPAFALLRSIIPFIHMNYKMNQLTFHKSTG
jgi:hypothetical protein